MESINESNEDSTANRISFNQDFSLISIGTNCGYKIIQISPLLIHEKNLLGSISHCELSYRSNLLALIGGGKIPKFNPKKVVIYNDLEDSVENEFKFSTPVLNVKFKKTHIFIPYPRFTCQGIQRKNHAKTGIFLRFTPLCGWRRGRRGKPPDSPSGCRRHWKNRPYVQNGRGPER